MVRAANSDGVWNEHGAGLRIVVQPQWWQTWWFLLLAILGSAAIISFGVWRRIAWLRREHAVREEYLQRERDAQTAFSRQLIESQENERHRLARDLHDDLKNELTLINFAVLRHLHEPQAGDRWRAEWELVAKRTKRAIAVIVELVRGLRPQILEAGLTAALQSIVNQANHAAGTVFTEDISEVDGVLPKEAEIHLYRIAQECVSNIFRHAQATAAKMTIRRDSVGLRFTMQDNGRGFDPAAVTSCGFGLTNITQRVQILGGTLEIKAVPSQGTTVIIKLELPQKMREEKP